VFGGERPFAVTAAIFKKLRRKTAPRKRAFHPAPLPPPYKGVDPSSDRGISVFLSLFSIGELSWLFLLEAWRR